MKGKIIAIFIVIGIVGGIISLSANGFGSVGLALSTTSSTTITTSLTDDPSTSRISDSQHTSCLQDNATNGFSQSIGIPLSYGELVPDMWGITAGNGSVSLCYSPSANSVATAITLSDIKYNTQYGPAGYPDIVYGPQYSQYPTDQSPLLKLPIQLSLLPSSLIAYSNYSITNTSSTPMDFAYDIWMSQNPQGLSWLGGNDTTIEMMIWLDSSGLQPAGSDQHTITESATLNGSPASLQWEVWISHGNGNSSTVSFRLNQSLSDTNIGISISDFISLTQKALGINMTSYYLDGIDIGSEFGQNGHPAANYLWDLYEYYFLVNDTNKVNILG